MELDYSQHTDRERNVDITEVHTPRVVAVQIQL